MSESVIGVVPTLKKGKSFGRWDTFTMVVTDSRSIFAQMTSDMLKQIGMEAQKQAKEEGKGFFARWGAQMKAHLSFSQRYLAMSPDETLGEYKDNFAIANSDIRSIKIRSKSQSSGNDDADRIVTEITIESPGKKLSYTMDSFSNDTKNMLKSVFGDRVK
ncbi:MAG: hypothetical protein JW846_03120 [Dehalococcoidia bacterium]|nr:hypothetical protein [Dehalococcoidia bacterium]